MPSGPGLRVDTFGYAGYTTSPNFDSLLAKLIAHSPGGSLEDALKRAYRGLCEFKIDGVATNIGFLQALQRRHWVDIESDSAPSVIRTPLYHCYRLDSWTHTALGFRHRENSE